MANVVNSEEVVVRWVEGISEAPKELSLVVDAYRRRAKIADGCKSYPRSVQDDMDKLFDAMVVLAREAHS